MTDLRGRTFSGLVANLNAGQHLAVDAVVAFVDGELEPGARDRAVAHIGHCPGCAAEVAAQRQARAAVRSAAEPAMPAGLLAALCSIPDTAELPTTPDTLATTGDGTVVLARQRPTGSGPTVALGSALPLGSIPRFGGRGVGLGNDRGPEGRRGTVVSGLVLGALIMVTPAGTPVPESSRPQSPPPVTPVMAPGSQPTTTSPEPSTALEPRPRPDPVLRPVAVVPEDRTGR
jgi:hypothetical protein